jgi:SsrA-binding protein
MNRPAAGPAGRRVAVNRKARHNYIIEDTIEAGLVLTGSEVKSLRSGQGNIAEAYATERKGELFLVNSYIPEYGGASRFNHEPRRPRKLLLRKREVNRLVGAVTRQGMTIVPLSLYFNERGIAKVDLALASGKKRYDKRATEKERSWQRDKARLLRRKD